MIVIGITGSIGSGKSTVVRLIAKKKYPFFSADKAVLNLYKDKKFVKLLIKKFNLNKKKKIKPQIKSIIKKKNDNIRKLESIFHPLVRKKMNDFLKTKAKILILEIPLLIEKKLNKYFDVVVFVDAKKKIRLKRYLKYNKDERTFQILNKKQLSATTKKKFCDVVIKNNSSLAVLKKNVKKYAENHE